MPNTPPNQNQTQSTVAPPSVNAPPTIQTPPESSVPKKKTSWLFVFVIILLLSATGVLGYKYYEVKQQLDNQQSSSSISSPSPQLIASPSPVEIKKTDNQILEELIKKEWINSKGNPVSMREILVSDIQVIDNWAMGNIVATALPGGGPEANRFMGSKIKGKWNVALEYTPRYLNWFKQGGSSFFEDQKAYEFLRDEHYNIQ